MGWYYGYGYTRKDVIAELTADNDHVKTLRKFTSGNTLWTVQETKDGQRFIGCYLMQRAKEGWGYKPMDESMGPCETTCPLAFFDMVPCPEGYAVEWRKRVREDAARRNIKLTLGDIVRLVNAENYRVTSVRPLKGVSVKTGILYKLPRKMISAKITPLVITVVEDKAHLAQLLDDATKGGRQ